MEPHALNIGFAHFAGCSGCQLMLANCEAELPVLANAVVFAEAAMLTSRRTGSEPFDLLLVEGAIVSADQRRTLEALRARSSRLVAVGECALSGGINRFGHPGCEQAKAYVYGETGNDIELLSPRGIEQYVAVDFRIPGCPPERSDFLELFGSLRCGGWPVRRQAPVCMECRINENRCLLEEDRLLCLGSLTRGGCAARCPGIGVPCEGCRGEVAEANRDGLSRLLSADLLPEQEVRRRLQRFGGVDS